MELYFLGTGAGLPSKERNVTAIALSMQPERGSFWLVDCGEATQHQILEAPLRLPQLEKIFITHLHGDHIYGLPGLLGSRSFQAGSRPLTLYGPVGLRDFVHTSLSVSQTYLNYDLEIVEIAEEGLVFQDHQFTVTCKKLQHGVTCYGYRIEEAPLMGHLNREKLEADGLAPGPLYQKLKAGQDITLEDGRLFRSSDYLSQPARGRIVTILGDTRPCAAIYELAHNATVLVHEATYGQDEAEKARAHNHSTTEDAALAAKEAGAHALILTHISSRYDETDLSALCAEAQAIFQNTDIAADHARFPIPRPSS